MKKDQFTLISTYSLTNHASCQWMLFIKCQEIRGNSFEKLALPEWKLWYIRMFTLCFQYCFRFERMVFKIRKYCINWIKLAELHQQYNWMREKTKQNILEANNSKEKNKNKKIVKSKSKQVYGTELKIKKMKFFHTLYSTQFILFYTQLVRILISTEKKQTQK